MTHEQPTDPRTNQTTNQVSDTMSDPTRDPEITSAPSAGAAPTAPQPTAPQPTGVPSGAPTAGPAAPAAPMPAATVITGPAPVPIILGLLGLAVAVLGILSRTNDLTIDWGRAGPVSVVGAGLFLVLLGLVGMRGQRRKGQDA